MLFCWSLLLIIAASMVGNYVVLWLLERDGGSVFHITRDTPFIYFNF